MLPEAGVNFFPESIANPLLPEQKQKKKKPFHLACIEPTATDQQQ
jgi:hypothetical protein